MEVFDPPDRHGKCRLFQREFEKRACRDDMQFRQLFVKVTKRAQHAGGGLNLVQKKERFSRLDFSAEPGFEKIQNRPGVIAFKKGAGCRVALQIDLADVLKFLLGKHPDEE